MLKFLKSTFLIFMVLVLAIPLIGCVSTSKYEQVVEERNSIEEELSITEEQLSNVEDDLFVSEEENTQLHDEIITLQTEVNELSKDFAELGGENEQLRNQISALNTKIYALEEDLATIQELKFFKDETELIDWLNYRATELGNIESDSPSYVHLGHEVQRLATLDGYFVSFSVSDWQTPVGLVALLRCPITFTMNPQNFYLILCGSDSKNKVALTKYLVGGQAV
jgi:outer membrane murein-binding lipoprotein Lpp